MRRSMICIFGSLSLLFPAVGIFAFTVDEIISKLEQNKNRIMDIQADVVLEIEVDGIKTVQEMKMWSKGDKTRIEFDEDQDVNGLPKTVITDDRRMIIETSRGKEVIDIKETDQKEAEARNDIIPLGFELQKEIGNFLRESDVNIMSERGNEITLSIIPKQLNQLMQKLDMVVDIEKGVISQQKIYSNMGISFCKMEYEQKDNAWVLSKFIMISSYGQMGTSKIKTEYKNIQVNSGIEDIIFE
jgi:outer membrane lipoprotein-sorting protein